MTNPFPPPPPLPIDLAPLQAQLAAAGFDVSNGLGMASYDAATVHTYDAAGQPVDLPAEAQPIIDTFLANARASA